MTSGTTGAALDARGPGAEWVGLHEHVLVRPAARSACRELDAAPDVEAAMRVPLYDPRAQHVALKDELTAALAAVLERGGLAAEEAVTRFESRFAEFCGVQHCVAAGSGTEAFGLVLCACDVGPGDEVILPGNAAAAAMGAVYMRGATPALVEIDPETLAMDAEAAAAAVTRATKAIVVAHRYGLPADIGPLRQLAAAIGIPLIEDAGEAVGARLGGRPTGSLGRAAVFDFQPTLGLDACGNAAAITTDDDALAAQLRAGRVRGLPTGERSSTSEPLSRLDALQAAVLGVKLRHLPAWNRRRVEIAATYDRALGGLPLGLPARRADRSAVFSRYVVRTDGRDALLGALRTGGVDARAVEAPACYRAAFRRVPMRVGRLHEARRAAAELIALPLYPEMSADQVRHVTRTVQAAFEDGSVGG